MQLDEAIRKYGILIPSDSEFYSKEYQEYFKGKTDYNELEYEKYRPFHDAEIEALSKLEESIESEMKER